MISPAPLPPISPTSIEGIAQVYGDLIFDLCESILWSPAHSQLAFREIFKLVRKKLSPKIYDTYRREWILRIAYEKLATLAKRHARKISPTEQIELDASSTISGRLKRFDHYFHKLPYEDQILLLLKDKYGLPYSEISVAMNVPQGSLKTRRQQALRTLEEWLWA